MSHENTQAALDEIDSDNEILDKVTPVPNGEGKENGAPLAGETAEGEADGGTVDNGGKAAGDDSGAPLEGKTAEGDDNGAPLAGKTTEGKDEDPSVDEGGFSPEEVAAVESLNQLMLDSYEAGEDLGYRVANLTVGVLKQSHGLESFGLESDFRVRNEDDLCRLSDAFDSVQISVGNEGFWEELFLTRNRLAQKRIAELNALSGAINGLPEKPTQEKFKTASLKKLHFNGSGKLDDVIKGIQNQNEVSEINQRSFIKGIMTAYEEYCVRVAKRFNKEGESDKENAILKVVSILLSLLAKRQVDVGSLDSPAEKEADKFFSDAAKNWNNSLKKVVLGGKEERAVCGGFVYRGRRENQVSIKQIRLSMKLVKDSKWSDAKWLRGTEVETPSPSQLKTLFKELESLADNSQVERDVLELQEAEMRDIYARIENEIRGDGPDGRDKLLKFLAAGRDHEEEAADTAVWASYPLGELMDQTNLHNLRTVEAGIKYIEDALKAYK